MIVDIPTQKEYADIMQAHDPRRSKPTKFVGGFSKTGNRKKFNKRGTNDKYKR